MEQIITLGIGGEPENLTPFITTGLEVGEVAEVFIVCATATVTVLTTATATITECD